MDFILDNSVVMRWLLRDGSAENQRYAEAVLASMTQKVAGVPSLWWLELASVIAKSERKGLVQQAESEQFRSLLTRQPIRDCPMPGPQLLDRTLALARQHGMSSYDAAYLELAIQTRLPLATLDAQLRQVATRVGVAVHLSPLTPID